MKEWASLFVGKKETGESPLIELKHLGKTFRDGAKPVVAIKDINLTIEDGDIFGVIGLSGAGKSTLIRCINFLEKPTEGQVIFDGVDLGSLKHSELLRTRQRMSMIFQGFNLLAQRTALENVCYPLEIAHVKRKAAREKARKLLEIVGLGDREKAYPSQLSGGQKQRVAIARALATDPKVLLCDEATSALDPNTTRSILELLKKINAEMGVTIIVITHEMKVIEQICNRVAVIDQSHIVEQGLVKDVFLAPKSRIARELILPQTEAVEEVHGERKVRIVFDGNSAFEPVISNLTLECHAAVNILGADTKNIDGKAYGQMLLQLPEDENAQSRIFNYLNTRKIPYEEVC
ncbi:MAG: ATP-binding cassette domain-containing protein [Clostridiales bacterium]|nr:ATP-binding cassette domain-containing protein [Clostridiales bacterium]